jgi:A/G-specific adenine glycosylase
MIAPTPNANERRRKYTSGGRDLFRDAAATKSTLLGEDMISSAAHPSGFEFSDGGHWPTAAQALIRWFGEHARALPWREPGVTPWGVLTSEIMLQQTQVDRVRPVWEEWVHRWPSPAALAAQPLAEALRAWGRLGYPRRAARLHEASRVIVAEHDGEVPDQLDALLALPGVGAYTARAVLAFAFGQRAPVVDVNVRRVLRRIRHGEADGPARAQDLPDTLALLPEEPAAASALSAALMELGQTVCLPHAPNCAACPIHPCRWARAGKPETSEPAARQAPRYAGSDRQARGALLAALRASAEPLRKAELDQAWLVNPAQRERALSSLMDDGLVHVADSGRIALGATDS